MIPFYYGPEIDCFNCIHHKRVDGGEISCQEGHGIPKPYEQCGYQKNEYRWKLEVIERWLKGGGLTEGQRMQALAWKEECSKKCKEQERIDLARRREEKEINERGIDAVYMDGMEDDG